MSLTQFQQLIWNHYRTQGRDLPWRNIRDDKNGHRNPYKILVSEIMLQQTQVARVIHKYNEWLKVFPTFKTLAEADTKSVLLKWQGLGYNRRALNLKRAAEIITNEHQGKLTPEILLDDSKILPGLGAYTKGAILAFAFNIGTAFIETNIRTVFIHHYTELTGKKVRGKIEDKKLFPLIEQTLDKENPREWYYALMDYGAYLKQIHPNPSRKSKHHTKQSKFEGSNRQMRSRILKYILTGPKTEEEILKYLHTIDLVIQTNLKDLEKEGFIKSQNKIFSIR